MILYNSLGQTKQELSLIHISMIEVAIEAIKAVIPEDGSDIVSK